MRAPDINSAIAYVSFAPVGSGVHKFSVQRLGVRLNKACMILRMGNAVVINFLLDAKLTASDSLGPPPHLPRSVRNHDADAPMSHLR